VCEVSQAREDRRWDFWPEIGQPSRLCRDDAPRSDLARHHPCANRRPVLPVRQFPDGGLGSATNTATWISSALPPSSHNASTRKACFARRLG